MYIKYTKDYGIINEHRGAIRLVFKMLKFDACDMNESVKSCEQIDLIYDSLIL